MYSTSHEDDSSNDKTTSAGERVAQVLQSRFDHGDNDTRPIGGISIETHSRRHRSVETTSVSSKFYTASSRASSRCRPAKGRKVYGGATCDEDLLISIEADFSRDEVHADLGAWRRSLRSRFPPC